MNEARQLTIEGREEKLAPSAKLKAKSKKEEEGGDKRTVLWLLLITSLISLGLYLKGKINLSQIKIKLPEIKWEKQVTFTK